MSENIEKSTLIESPFSSLLENHIFQMICACSRTTSSAKFCQRLYCSAKCACSFNTPAVPWTVAIRLTHAHCRVTTATIKASKFPREIWGRRPRPAGSRVLSLECSLWSSLRLHPSVRLTAIVLIILECWRTLSVCISLCLIVLSSSSGILLFPGRLAWLLVAVRKSSLVFYLITH